MIKNYEIHVCESAAIHAPKFHGTMGQAVLGQSWDVFYIHLASDENITLTITAFNNHFLENLSINKNYCFRSIEVKDIFNATLIFNSALILLPDTQDMVDVTELDKPDGEDAAAQVLEMNNYSQRFFNISSAEITNINLNNVA